MSDKNKEYLKRLPFYDHLNEDECMHLAQSTVVRHYDKGEFVHGGTDTCTGMIHLIKGSIRAYLLSPEGREITLYKLHAGETCMLSASCVISQITFDTYIEADADCELMVISAGVFEKIMSQNVYVKCEMYELGTERFSSAMWAMQQLLFAGMDQRLAGFLLDECERTGKNEVRMTHEKIAQQINSAREVVARMLKRFSEEGMVEVKRGTVIITDKKALEDLL